MLPKAHASSHWKLFKFCTNPCSQQPRPLPRKCSHQRFLQKPTTTGVCHWSSEALFEQNQTSPELCLKMYDQKGICHCWSEEVSAKPKLTHPNLLWKRVTKGLHHWSSVPATIVHLTPRLRPNQCYLRPAASATLGANTHNCSTERLHVA